MCSQYLSLGNEIMRDFKPFLTFQHRLECFIFLKKSTLEQKQIFWESEQHQGFTQYSFIFVRLDNFQTHAHTHTVLNFLIDFYQIKWRKATFLVFWQRSRVWELSSLSPRLEDYSTGAATPFLSHSPHQHKRQALLVYHRAHPSEHGHVSNFSALSVQIGTIQLFRTGMWSVTYLLFLR